MRHIKTFILLFLSLSCFGQNSPTSVKQWKTYAVPQNEDSLSVYNASTDNWMVMKMGEEVMVMAERIFHSGSNYRLN